MFRASPIMLVFIKLIEAFLPFSNIDFMSCDTAEEATVHLRGAPNLHAHYRKG